MNDQPDRLEAELAALQPHAPSPDLRRRIAADLDRPAPRASYWRAGLVVVGGGLVAACLLVMILGQQAKTTFESVGTMIGMADGRARNPVAATEEAPSRVNEVKKAAPAPTSVLAPYFERNASILVGTPKYEPKQFSAPPRIPGSVVPEEAVGIRDGAPNAPPVNLPAAGGPADRDPNHAKVEEYNLRNDHPFLLAQREPLSTFSVNVDTASYSNVRRMLLQGQMPPKDAVRIEEFVNYFTYNLPGPAGEHPILVSAEAAACPWRSEHQLVRIGLQGKRLADEDTPPRNLVFLIDTSGSMQAANRLPLLTQSLLLLARQLRRQDRVAIVAYAGSAGLVLPPTPGDDYDLIHDALTRLQAGGSTNGGHGIQLAYQTARESFIQGGLNRVILGTDGDFNVGVTGSELVRLVEKQRDSGIYLTLLGFGMGNLKDGTMEKLSRHGNGQYAYIDTLAEARRLFVEQIAGLVTIAKDVKIQVEFNPAAVQAYRLLGYESRMLQHQDFNDDKKDAGEMGAGHTVIALYEIVPPGVKIELPMIDPLKYQQPSLPQAKADELLTVKVRYIPPAEKQSRLLSQPLPANKREFAQASTDFRFAASAAAFGLLLRDSPYKGTATYADVLAWATDAVQPDPNGQRAEFLTLIRAAQRLAPQR